MIKINLTLIFLLIFTASLFADVMVREKSKIKFHGTVGSLVNAFSSAGDEQKSKTYVKGNFSRTEEEDEISILDLEKGQIITIDPKAKTYSVITIEDMKKQLQASADMLKSYQGEEKVQEDKTEPEKYEVLFDINRTGKSRKINGMSTEEIIMVVTLKQKGVALEDSGGMVITADMWLTENAPGFEELQAFQKKVVEKMDIPFTEQGMTSQITDLLYQYPQLKGAMDKLNSEMEKTGKIPVKSVTTVELVKSKQQMAEGEGDEADLGNLSSAKKLFGGFAKKLAKKKTASGNRTKLVDIYEEIEKIETKPLDPALFQVPANYKKIEAF